MGKCKKCKSWGRDLPDVRDAEECVVRWPDGDFKHTLKAALKNNEVFRVCSYPGFHGQLDYERCKTSGATYGEFLNMDSGYGEADYFVTGKDFGCIHFKEENENEGNI